MWLANAEWALYDYTVALAVFMIEVEQLLKPVSVEEPCRKNLSYDPGFLALEGLIAGKPETQFSAAEEPDWKAVRDACLALLGQSKGLPSGQERVSEKPFNLRCEPCLHRRRLLVSENKQGTHP
jgi:hypothetical protein